MHPLFLPTPALPPPTRRSAPPPRTLTTARPAPTLCLPRPGAPRPPTMPPPNKWSIAVAASVVHALHATAVYMGPATLLSPMRHSLNLSVAEVTLPLNVYRAVQALFLIPSGFLLDLIGPQLSLRVAITAAALLAPLLPLVTSLPQLVLLQALFSVTKLFGGLSALLLITAAAFANSSGLASATSILLSGYSFAGFLAPAVIGALSTRFGWRIAFSFLSATFILVALPITFHFLRETPDPSSKPRSPLAPRLRRALNSLLPTPRPHRYAPAPQAPHDRPPLTVSASAPPHLPSVLTRPALPVPAPNTPVPSPRIPQTRPPPPAPAVPAADPLLTPPFLAIALAVASFSFTMNIVFDHLLVFLNEDFGLPFKTATFYMSIFNLIALFSKLGVGPLADRFNKAALILFFSVMGVAASCLLLDFTATTLTVTSSFAKVIGFIVFCTLRQISQYPALLPVTLLKFVFVDCTRD